MHTGPIFDIQHSSFLCNLRNFGILLDQEYKHTFWPFLSQMLSLTLGQTFPVECKSGEKEHSI